MFFPEISENFAINFRGLLGEDWALDRTGLIFYHWKQQSLCQWVKENSIWNGGWGVSPISAEQVEPRPYVQEEDPCLSEQDQSLAHLEPMSTMYPPQLFSISMLSSVKLHNSLPVLSVMRLILSALGTFWQATFVTEQESTITLLLRGQIIEKVGTLQTHSALTPVWSWCDSARNRCSLLQSFSCETWKHCLRHSVPHSAFFNRQSRQGAELSDLPESTQEVTHLGIKNGLWSSAFQHSFQPVSLFWREISIPFTFLWPPCFCL